MYSVIFAEMKQMCTRMWQHGRACFITLNLREHWVQPLHVTERFVRTEMKNIADLRGNLILCSRNDPGVSSIFWKYSTRHIRPCR